MFTVIWRTLWIFHLKTSVACLCLGAVAVSEVQKKNYFGSEYKMSDLFFSTW